MRNMFSILTALLVVVGFVIPVAWVGAIITALLAVASAPPGLRPDGKGKTGGLFGGMWDNFAISKTMMDCPYCRSKILKEALKCPHCAEWIVKQNIDE